MRSLLMGNFRLSHHSDTLEGYRFHVVTIRGNDHCIGCFTNKMFFVFLLPLLYASVVDRSNINLVLEVTTMVFWGLSGILYLSEIVTGRKSLSRYFELVKFGFILSGFLLILSSRPEYQFNYYLLVGLLSMPQLLLYLFKVTFSREFEFPKFKLLIRLSFILGLFFFVLELTPQEFPALILGGFLFYLFIKLRIFSVYHAEADKSLMATFKIPDQYQNIIEKSVANQSLIEKIGLFILLALGLIVVISHNPAACSNPAQQTAMSSIAAPLVLGSSNPSITCASCGEPISLTDKFCSSCGTSMGSGVVDPTSESTIDSENAVKEYPKASTWSEKPYDPNDPTNPHRYKNPPPATYRDPCAPRPRYYDDDCYTALCCLQCFCEAASDSNGNNNYRR